MNATTTMNVMIARPNLKAVSESGLDQLVIRLQGKLNGRIRDLHLSLDEYGIVLRGFARTYHAKQLAQHTLMCETELPIAANEIEVF